MTMADLMDSEADYQMKWAAQLMDVGLTELAKRKKRLACEIRKQADELRNVRWRLPV